MKRFLGLGLLVTFCRSSHAGDPPRPLSLESFRSAMKEARTIEDKAVQIQALGWADPGEPGIVAELSRFLILNPADINYLLPTTAASALGKMRGNRAAAQALVLVLSSFRKTPYLYRKVIAALGQVGHEASLPALQDLLIGNDPDAALLAASAMADLPADLALDGLFKSWDWMLRRRAKVGDDVKKNYDRVGAEILRVVLKISGEKYPSMTEMSVWWSKRAAKWKDIAAEREKERERTRTAATPPLDLPPVMLVELSCNELSGTTTVNLGSSSAMCPSATFTKNRPLWSHEIPPPGNAGSLDFGAEGGPYAADLPGPMEHLKNLKSFTIAGWINARSMLEGSGGNRVISWLDRDGVEIVHRADGSLQVGINQRADASLVRSPPQQVPAGNPTADAALTQNWRFFAVTYDSTAATAQAKIYVGTRDADAAVVTKQDYAMGCTGLRIAAGLSIGNLPAAQRPLNPKGSFRGLIDEVRIFGSTRDGSGALPAPAIVLLQARVPAP